MDKEIQQIKKRWAKEAFPYDSLSFGTIYADVQALLTALEKAEQTIESREMAIRILEQDLKNEQNLTEEWKNRAEKDRAHRLIAELSKEAEKDARNLY